MIKFFSAVNDWLIDWLIDRFVFCFVLLRRIDRPGFENEDDANSSKRRKRGSIFFRKRKVREDSRRHSFPVRPPIHQLLIIVLLVLFLFVFFLLPSTVLGQGQGEGKRKGEERKGEAAAPVCASLPLQLATMRCLLQVAHQQSSPALWE